MPETPTMSEPTTDILAATDRFAPRHLGPGDADIAAMLETLGLGSLDELTKQTVPAEIIDDSPLGIGQGVGENDSLKELAAIAGRNTVARSFIGQGYYGTITPPVILRNIFQNPGWYTQYTPYQAEISQGRLEALLNFQTMVCDLTGLPIANASLLDEPTAAAEAMSMCFSNFRGKRTKFFVADDCHPQTINVVRTRAWSMGVELIVGSVEELKCDETLCGVLLQYPNTYGSINDYSALISAVHDAGALVVMATDLLACCLIKPPGEWGADIAIGSAQRFGVPLGGGGPHAAFLSARQDLARKMPGRIVGVSKDAKGNPALRLAIQTREQHIKRDRATSNICTAQVLLAIMAGMYAVWHGPEGLKKIARRVNTFACVFARILRNERFKISNDAFFDTVTVEYGDDYTGAPADNLVAHAGAHGTNIRQLDSRTVSVSFDETTTIEDLWSLLHIFVEFEEGSYDFSEIAASEHSTFDIRHSTFLTDPVFSKYHCEHEMLRYIKRLEAKDLSLTTSMIPLGSCTMKLNSVSEMIPVIWDEFSNIHPYAPDDQVAGYAEMCEQLEDWLAKITGFAAVSLQPNAGSQGEYAGLLAIRGYHEANGDNHRTACLIPVSAHGTNPASAVIAGFTVVPVKCDPQGNIDVEDLKARAAEHKDELGALMITYPSTHGVFETSVKDICNIVHDHGGLVYMDGANMNAQVGLTTPGSIGADVCHLNLHKTFCIPHGGGGPGMGPIACTTDLEPFLPGDPLHHKGSIGPVSAARWGSASILPISWMYIRMMGDEGLKKATQVAILNANYMANRVKDHYPVLYTGKNGRVAHEFIIDLRPLRVSAAIEPEDVAKRLMDYGFHAPTMSWPVAGTLMIEPTESESRAELDRLCDALIAIREEIREIEQARQPMDDNLLKNAPHTAAAIADDAWSHPYSRKQAVFPSDSTRIHKYWPPVSRIDNVWGDRHLMCTCASVAEVAAMAE